MKVRQHRLTMSSEQFAAERQKDARELESALEEVAFDALQRVGVPRWEQSIVSAALDLFDRTVKNEADDYSEIIDVMREAFQVTISEALQKTKRVSLSSDSRRSQAKTIAVWLTRAALNAAVEAVVAADETKGVKLEWVTMRDDQVRETHAAADGQQRPVGTAFIVGDDQMFYPGEPVGDPSNFLNCRCWLRAAGISSVSLRASGESKTGVIVALPAEDDSVHLVANVDGGAHMTLLYLGETVNFDQEAIANAVTETVARTGLTSFSDEVSGSGTLGKDEASVLLMDGRGAKEWRDALLAHDAIAEAFENVEQFPNWTPHVTLGYPDQPQNGEYDGTPVTFNRLALWFGDDTSTEIPVPNEGSEAMVASVENDQTDPEEPTEIPLEELTEPIPWYGVLCPEGQPTGDSRLFESGSMRTRELPLPLKWMPSDKPGHDDSRIVGNMTRAVRHNGLIKAEGFFDVSPDAAEAIRQIASQMLRGVSVDTDDSTGSIEVDENGNEFTVFDSSRISAATLCAIPAFPHAFVSLGTWADAGEPLPDDDLEEVEDEDQNEGEGQNDPDDDMEFSISEDDWDGSASRFSDEEWERSCVLDRGEDFSTPKERYALPVREPNGDLSRAGVHAAASRLNQVDASDEAKSAARKKLAAAYKELGEEAPFSGSFANAPGVLKDGSAPTCKYCDSKATKYVLHAEGMAYIPACDEHIEQAKEDAEKATPDGEPDPGNIDRIGDYSVRQFAPVPPQTKDGPGWITDPVPTKRITDYWVDGRGAAKIGWGLPGDFNRCRIQLAKYVQNPEYLAGLCANLHYRALRVWPGQHGITGKDPVMKTITAAGWVPPGEWFMDPEFNGPSPMVVTEDGRVFGHLATWDVCHIGKGECVTAPHSADDYAWFATGEVQTTLGPVAVGQISLGGGHAGPRASRDQALAHYDSTSTAVADIVVGEDDYGIWFSGALRPTVSDQQVAALRAASLSGDWREIRRGTGNLELVAALAVNVPGFPIPRPSLVASGETPRTLLAAGIVRQFQDEADAERAVQKFKAVDAMLAAKAFN